MVRDKVVADVADAVADIASGASIAALEHLVTAGYLGRKTGRGFRDHTGR